jgi:hypothetical protein
MKPRHLFLALCFLGVLVPNVVLVPWLLEHGLDPGRFLDDLFANGVSAFFGLDVLVSAVALAAFVLIEGARLGLARRWLPILATCLVGVSFGLPLFLYQRQVYLDRAAVLNATRL